MKKIVAIYIVAFVSLILPAGAQTTIDTQLALCDSLNNAEQYEEAYHMAEALMQHTGLTDEQRQQAGEIYVNAGFYYAEHAAAADSYNPAVYQQLRRIMQAIKPYATDSDLELINETTYISLQNESFLHRSSLHHNEAIACFLDIIAMDYPGAPVSDKIANLEDLGVEYECIFDIDHSAQAYKEALALAHETDNLASQISILSKLKNLFSKVGDTRQATAYANTLDSVNNRVSTLIETLADGEQKHEYYIKRGEEYEAKRDFDVARQWYNKALAAAEAEGQDGYSWYRFDSLTHLLTLEYLAHNYDAAFSQGEKAIAEYRQKQEPYSPILWMTYRMMAYNCQSKGDIEGCKTYIDSLRSVSAHMTSPDERFQVKFTEAAYYELTDDYETAMAIYKEADAILAEQYSPTHEDRVDLLLTMARTAQSGGHHDEAERLCRQYADFCRQLYGEQHRTYLHSLIELANFEAFAQQHTEGAAHFAEAIGGLRHYMRRNLPFMSTSEREGFWSRENRYVGSMTSYAVGTNELQTPFTRASYSQLALSKAFLLSSEQSLFEAIQQEGTPADKKDYTTIAFLRAQIKELENNYAENANQILDLVQQVESLEKGLMERCRTFSSLTAYLDIDYDTVKQKLATGETLIDFVDYTRAETGVCYGAYVIDQQQELPLLQPLFAESEMEALGINHPDLYYTAYNAPEVLRLLWEPLRDHVAEGSTVYYVPSQLLFQISLEALPLPDGSLLGDHYHFVRLSSARELLKPRVTTLAQLPHTAVLYGGLTYNLESADMAAEASKYDVSRLLASRGEDTTSDDGTVRGHTNFNDLPNTLNEITQIGDILTDNDWKVTPYTGTQGTEESFLALHGQSPTILQIATHGFYYTPDRAEKNDFLKGYTDAMTLSGLVLAGGNAAWMGKPLPDGVMGGILTANHIARLDLSGTDMVVLSACQSGQGKATSEGLYGLQRAFKKAGVGTMILSLWSVDDKATADFMTTFYHQLAGPCQWDKHRAFDAARNIMKEKYTNPYYWAAFVMLD